MDKSKLLFAAMDGLEYGHAIISVHRDTNEIQVLGNNAKFSGLSTKISYQKFLLGRILDTNFYQEIFQIPPNQFLECSFSKFNYPDGNKELEYFNLFIKDITEKRRQDEEIAWRLRFELGVASSIQILIQNSSFETSLPQALYQLLNFTEMDSVFFLKTQDSEVLDFKILANERKVGSVPFLPKSLENSPWKEIGLGRWKEKLKQGKVIFLTKEQTLEKEKWFFDRGTELVLLIPVFLDQKFLGIFGFERFHKITIFEKENVLVYQTVARWLGLFVQRSDDQDELNKYKSNLESLVLERTIDLSKTREELEKAFRVKTDFLAQMSHELRTPLNSIIGFSKLIDLPEDDQTGKTYLKYIFEAGTKLLKMINEILALLRMESGELPIYQLRFDPIELCLTAKNTVQAMMQPNQGNIIFEVIGNKDWMNGDPGKIQQIILNLLTNSIKYAGKEPKIRLVLSFQETEVHFLVEDDGPGISAENRERVFQKFVRLHDHGNIEGAGLGLAISKGLAEKMGGSLALLQNEGKGCQFLLIIPKI
ncbi:ATP-binding protein [Leptospira sp. 96542]|nr:ATP-binding protein [Leptospira sp. 96542]